MLLAFLGLGACQETAAPNTDPRAAATGAWATPPRVAGVAARGDSLVISGFGPPGVRVVLTAEDQAPAAISVDDDGRFALPIPRPAAARLYRLDLDEPTARRAGERLFIAPDGTAAVLVPGGASRALNEVSGLVAADHDGVELIISGNAAPGSVVSVVLDDRPARAGRVDAAGRYELALGAAAAGRRRIAVQVDDGPPIVTAVTLAPQGDGTPGSRVDTEGLSLWWTPPGGGIQQTWIRRQKD
ncbi:hypothetical protein [Brevundimonas lutea]|uniref:hypothetical protein n=1 Tax=Brevundimonas lutea TaxID=2293980 RepID=UPI0013CEDC96|nr:hypothetical protein [Brevundimonas lutea]